MVDILSVFKDRGAAQVMVSILEAFSRMYPEYEVAAAAEAPGIEMWPATWRVLFRGTYRVDAFEVVRYYHPDVVVVGESFPNDLEGRFAQAAQQLGIKLVLLEDFWGGFQRIPGLVKDPDLILTLDDYAGKLVKQTFCTSSVVLIGNTGVREKIEGPSAEVIALRDRGFKVITFCGGSAETTEQIELLLRCLKVTSGNWRLIPRWHPGEIDKPDPRHGNQPYHVTWNAMLEPLGDRVIRVTGSADSIVVCSDVVCSGYSTLLTKAAHAGVAAISLATPQVEQMLYEESAAYEIPQVALGLARRVDAPTDLAQIQPCPEEARAKLKPFDPVIGARAICELLRKG